jgi:hypothetical protein
MRARAVVHGKNWNWDKHPSHGDWSTPGAGAVGAGDARDRALRDRERSDHVRGWLTRLQLFDVRACAREARGQTADAAVARAARRAVRQQDRPRRPALRSAQVE